MTPALINTLQLLIDALPRADRGAPQLLLNEMKVKDMRERFNAESQPKRFKPTKEFWAAPERWTDERRAKQSKTIKEYWANRRNSQPFQLIYRDKSTLNICGWVAAAKAAGVKESTLRIKFSKAGGLQTEFFDRELMQVVDIVKLPYVRKVL